MRRWLLAGIFLLAFLLRFVGLSDYPTGFTPDEASFGYDAHSLLETGKDQWGNSWPLSFRSFGDFKLPVYTYLALPAVASLGLNEFAVRFPSVLFGSLAVLATYFLTRELFKDKRIAYLASFLLAISPWHVALSRGAFEANLTTFFLPLGVLLFYKGLKNPKLLTLAAIVFGLNMFTYHSARLITPLVVLVLTFLNKEKFSVKKHQVPFLIFSFFVGLALLTVVGGGGARAGDITIFNPTDKWAGVFDRRFEAIIDGVPNSISRFFSNKPLYVFDRFVDSYSTYLSPQYLFTSGASEWTYGMIPGRGVLYLFELPFILLALWFLAKRGTNKSLSLKLIVLWIILSPIPAALTKGPGYAGNRAAIMMPALQIFSAFGGILLYDLVVSKWKKIGKKIIVALFILISFVSLIYFLEDYRYHASRSSAGSMLYGRKEAVDYIREIEDNYSEIIFSRTLSEPQIFVGFYKNWSPEEYQKESRDWLRYEEEGLLFLDQLGEYRLGKYTFRNIHFNEDKKVSGALLVGKPNEFPFEVDALNVINYPNQEPAIIIVDPDRI